MALLNFLYQGSYGIADDIYYSKKDRHLRLNFKVFSDSTKETEVISVPFVLNGHNNYISVKGMSNTPPETSSEGDMWAILSAGTGVWEEKGKGLVIKEGGIWNNHAIDSGVIVKDDSTSDYYNLIDNSWVEYASAKNWETWDQYFDVDAISGENNNLIKQIYEWLKTKPEFSSVTSDE